MHPPCLRDFCFFNFLFSSIFSFLSDVSMVGHGGKLIPSPKFFQVVDFWQYATVICCDGESDVIEASVLAFRLYLGHCFGALTVCGDIGAPRPGTASWGALFEALGHRLSRVLKSKMQYVAFHHLTSMSDSGKASGPLQLLFCSNNDPFFRDS